MPPARSRRESGVEGKGAMEGSHGGEPWVVAWLTASEPVSAPTWSVLTAIIFFLVSS